MKLVYVVFGLDADDEGRELGSSVPLAAFFDKDEAEKLSKRWRRWGTSGTVVPVQVEKSADTFYTMKARRLNEAVRKAELRSRAG